MTHLQRRPASCLFAPVFPPQRPPRRDGPHGFIPSSHAGLTDLVSAPGLQLGATDPIDQRTARGIQPSDPERVATRNPQCGLGSGSRAARDIEIEEPVDQFTLRRPDCDFAVGGIGAECTIAEPERSTGNERLARTTSPRPNTAAPILRSNEPAILRVRATQRLDVFRETVITHLRPGADDDWRLDRRFRGLNRCGRCDRCSGATGQCDENQPETRAMPSRHRPMAQRSLRRYCRKGSFLSSTIVASPSLNDSR